MCGPDGQVVLELGALRILGQWQVRSDGSPAAAGGHCYKACAYKYLPKIGLFSARNWFHPMLNKIRYLESMQVIPVVAVYGQAWHCMHPVHSAMVSTSQTEEGQRVCYPAGDHGQPCSFASSKEAHVNLIVTASSKGGKHAPRYRTTGRTSGRAGCRRRSACCAPMRTGHPSVPT